MHKIIILGSTGMLGRYIERYFLDQDMPIVALSRKDFDASVVSEFELSRKLFPSSVVINCIGLIKPQVDKYGTLEAIKVNSAFPHKLANVCKKIGSKCIHITTDCVYSGSKGAYIEDDVHDASDIYGKTKSLGEPRNCTVIRTSIIGEEVHQTRSLLEWVKSQNNKDINGYTNHTWNGVTCLELAKIILNIIKHKKYWEGVRHVFSPKVVSKDELLGLIAGAMKLNIEIRSSQAPQTIKRHLLTSFPEIKAQDLKTQLHEIYKFSRRLYE